MHCSTCGGAIPLGNRFCSSCGAPAAMQCATCGGAIPLGNTFCSSCGRPAQVLAAQPRPTPRRAVSAQWVSVLGGGSLGLVVLATVALFAWRGVPTAVSPASPASNGVVPVTSEEPKLLAPQEFATTSRNLATAIADLNRAELKFVQDAQAGAINAATLDADLREVAARAMSVAQSAEALGLTAVAQEGGSDAAGRMAGQYYALARLAYGLVIEAQNLREGLPARTITRADAIHTMADYGARLWHASVTGPGTTGNPFLPNLKDAATVAPVQFLSSNAVAQLNSQVGPAAPVLAWLATSQEVVTRTVDLPAPRAPVSNPFDAQVVKTLTAASEQGDADRARQVAAANLALLVASPSPTAPAQIGFAVFKGASLADANQVAAGTVPSFAKGTASALARGSGGTEDLVSTLFELDGQAPPRTGGKASVKETKPLVTLRVLVLRFEGTMDDIGGQHVFVRVKLAWETPLAGPQIWLNCGFSPIDVTTTGGSLEMDGSFMDWGWRGQGYVRCEAWAGDRRVGQASILVDVPAEYRETPTALASPEPTLTPTRLATPSPTAAPPTPTPPPAAPIRGRLVIDYGMAQSGRQDAGAALRAGSSRCEPEVAIAPDGTVSGDCENKDARRNPASPYVMTALVAGKGDPRSGSFVFTYEVAEISPSLPPPFSDRVTWRISYSGSGTFTSATEASGMANFSYGCDGTDTLRWCGPGGGATAESFAGTVPWRFGPAN